MAPDKPFSPDAQASTSQDEVSIRVLVESLGIGLAVIGPDMRVLEANACMRRWFPDYTSQALCHTVFHHPSRATPCENCPVRQAFADEKMHVHEREA
ncbi:MAG: hypothetical protein EA402_03545 [Planctomycetota bacterium]|nr:MAG: hypothetical protein EA402_03545 [Planctomycetota bacterium]